MSGYGIQKKGTSPILKQAGSPGPTVPILPEDFAQGPKLPDDIAAKQRSGFKKGGKAMDESMAHEDMESMKMESKETRMEKKGFKEIKSGKMVKEKMAKGGLTTPTIPPALKKGMKKIGLKDGGQTKVGKVMREFGQGKLHSGKKGPVVKSRKQAIAIALSEAGKSKMAKGGRPGLWANINARKKAGTSRSKSESTISPKAYANMKAGFPKKKK
jgi:hypothetical protein